MKKITKLFLGLAGISAVSAGLAVGFAGKSGAISQVKADTQAYASTIRVYVDFTWDNISQVMLANTSGSPYSGAVLSASASSSIASFISANGKYVSDVNQTSAVAGTSASSLRLYYTQTGTMNADFHPTVSGTKDWDKTNNYLTLLSGNPGDVFKISGITYNYGYDDNTQKWFTYSVTKLGQLLHFNANGGVLPSGQSETVEVDATTSTLPAACTRSSNDGYVFDKWTYGGTNHAAGDTITLASGTNDVYATYTVTAASFASYIMDSARDSESCATKYAAAKALTDQMSPAEKTNFTPTAYADAYARWTAWKAANKDTTTTPSAVVGSSDKTSTLVLGGIAVVAVLAAGGYFFVRKKKVD